MASSPHIYSQTIQMYTENKRKEKTVVVFQKTSRFYSSHNRNNHGITNYKLHLFLQKTVHK